MTDVKFSLFTKDSGFLTKRMRLEGWRLVKDVSECWLSAGRVEVVDIAFNKLPDFLDSVEQSQAVSWGIPSCNSVLIVAQKYFVEGGDAICRTRDFFEFPAGPGVLMLDNDSGLSPVELEKVLFEVCPELGSAARIMRPSCSAGIYNDEELLTSADAGRLYVLVSDARDIPRAGEVLFQRLILKGFGEIKISRAGLMLLRSSIDESVFQPERLDFVAPPVLDSGLTRRAKPAGYIDGVILDTLTALPDLSGAEERRFDAIAGGLKAQYELEADRIKEIYLVTEIGRLVEEHKLSRATAEKVICARLSGSLDENDVLYFDKAGSVKVADVLAAPEKYNRETLADPAEPEYGGGRCKAMFFSNDGKAIIRSFAHGGQVYYLGKVNQLEIARGARAEVGDKEPDIPDWPTMDHKAYRGFAGDFVRLATRKSEADPAAVLLTFLVRFGVECSRGKSMAVGDTQHRPVLASVIVGSSGKSRKGTSAKPVQKLFAFDHLCPDFGFWESARVSNGPFSSGEGIIYAVRDKVMKWDLKEQTEMMVDPGVEDKRLFVLDEEFGGVLANTKRDGNTLSMIIRMAWDTGDLDPLTKNNKICATGSRVGWISHITLNELYTKLPASEGFNGFGNRILWGLSRRNKLVAVPEPMPEIELEELQRRLLSVLRASIGDISIKLSPGALAAWKDRYYADLTQDRPGLSGCITNRGEAQVLRLAMLYAMLDSESIIRLEHLEAGLAVWDYCRKSAHYIFGGMETDGTAQTILEALMEQDLTGKDLYALFNNNRSKKRLETALSELLASGQVVCEKVSGKRGAPTNVYCFVENPYEINEKNELNLPEPPVDLFNSLNSFNSLSGDEKKEEISLAPTGSDNLFESL